MIALGESVIAIGMGVDGSHVTAGIVYVVVLALALPGAMWWAYFTDYHAAEHALGGAENEARTLLAIRAYYFAHIPVLLGITIPTEYGGSGLSSIPPLARTGGRRRRWPGRISLFLAESPGSGAASIGRPPTLLERRWPCWRRFRSARWHAPGFNSPGATAWWSRCSDRRSRRAGRRLAEHREAPLRNEPE
jgi:hypothetical protein